MGGGASYIPRDVCLMILKDLDLKTLVGLRRVCRAAQRMVDKCPEAFWGKYRPWKHGVFLQSMHHVPKERKDRWDRISSCLFVGPMRIALPTPSGPPVLMTLTVNELQQTYLEGLPLEKKK